MRPLVGVKAKGRPSLALAGLLAVVVAIVSVESAASKPPFRNPGDNTPYIEHAWVEFSGVEFDSQFTRVAANVISPRTTSVLAGGRPNRAAPAWA